MRGKKFIQKVSQWLKVVRWQLFYLQDFQQHTNMVIPSTNIFSSIVPNDTTKLYF